MLSLNLMSERLARDVDTIFVPTLVLSDLVLTFGMFQTVAGNSLEKDIPAFWSLSHLRFGCREHAFLFLSDYRGGCPSARPVALRML
mmetsp:Transcript_6198/g.12224  ORF Transcript_6198/g.12224 Transcript_6198/m.12224 type:complete len:87 (+) Transcript_6198:483-743(+)